MKVKSSAILDIILGGKKCRVFSRGHATLELAVSVSRSVGRSVGQIFDLRVVFALPLLPNRPRLDCRVSGLVCRRTCMARMSKKEMIDPVLGQ